MRNVIIRTMLLLALVANAAGQRKARATEPMECDDLKAGQAVTRKTATIATPSGSIRAYATVRLSRPPDDTDGNSCEVVYKLFVAEGTGPFALAKEYSDSPDGLVGVEMVGVSKNETKLAADFWWAAGDYTGHRPVIYDAKTKSVHFRELNDEILNQLTSCDYFEDFAGVNDAGEAIIDVPKSSYVEKGCPAQGRWLFDVQTGRVHRMK